MANTQATISGSLYIVATPIGNKDDLSHRALATLQTVDIILAEDTRHSKPFLKSLGVFKPLLSLHEHNEEQKTAELILGLKSGKSYALISDAGTPLISDPGFVLVREARKEKIRVVPIPGPSALITALCSAGIPADHFSFGGFLPAKAAARITLLEQAFSSHQTYIFYESTHRLLATIEDIISIYGPDFRWVIAKELTKQFENILDASSLEHKLWFAEDPSRIKGEFVLILPAKAAILEDNPQEKELLSLLLTEMPLSKAVKLASEFFKKPKNHLYQLALTLKNSS